MKILLLFMSLSAFALDCNIHKIYCKIVKLQPDVDRRYAKRLSDLLYRHSKTPMISVAIAMQESGLSFRHRYGRIYYDNRVAKGVTDFGTFQIHIDTAKRYGLDLQKLDTDLEYNVIWHSKILEDKIKACKKLGKKAFSCYHSFTKVYRENYYRLVRRYL